MSVPVNIRNAAPPAPPNPPLTVETADRRTHTERLSVTGPGVPRNDHMRDAEAPAAAKQESPPTMTPEQFEELKAMLRELLTPGYVLSKLYLERFHADEAQRAETPSADPEHPAS